MPEFAVAQPGADGAVFVIGPVNPYAPTADETTWYERINWLVARLSRPETAGDEHSEARVLREALLAKLRRQSDAICAAAAPDRAPLVRKSFKDSYWDQGVYTDRVTRIGQLPFDVVPIQGQRQGLIVDIEIMTRNQTLPEDKQKFKVQLDQAITVVKSVFPDEDAPPPAPDGWGGRAWAWLEQLGTPRAVDYGPLKSEYLKALVGIARVGLMGQDATQTPFAVLALTGFANEFVAREGGRVKNRYVRKLGVNAGLAVVVAALCYGLAGTLAATHADWTLFRFRNFFILVGGAAVGTWLSFSIRRQVLTFQDLGTLEDDRLNPGLRILFMVALTTVVGLIFWTEMVVLTIGNFHTDFRLTGSYAALIGALCGIAERSLTGAVSRRASELVAGLGGTAKPGG